MINKKSKSKSSIGTGNFEFNLEQLNLLDDTLDNDLHTNQLNFMTNGSKSNASNQSVGETKFFQYKKEE
jgi:hypothetical protein